MRRILIAVAAVLAVQAVVAFLVAWSGLYNVAASVGHWPITRWFLTFAMTNSVETHAWGIDVPPLDDPALFYKGLGHFQGGCAPCHGTPGTGRNPIPLRMLPEPPRLETQVADWTAADLFWIVKHGLKYTGMPAWPAPQRDDEVWAMVAFLQRLPALTQAEYARLARGDVPHDARGGEASARLIAAVGSAGEGLVVCGRCHGLSGAGGGAGAFPRLAGQKAEYLLESLRSYAAGLRPSGVMAPVAAALREDEMEKLAAYYAATDAPFPHKPTVDDLALLQLGGAIAISGLPAQRIPACSSCHGEAGLAADKHPLYPRLAGQYAEYLILQLKLWRAGIRGGTAAPLMTAAAAALSDEQIRAVALYYASLRPDDWTPRRAPEALHPPARSGAN